MFYLAVTDGRAPRFPHPSLEEAQVEAHRLAEKTNRRVTVYRLVEVVDPAAKEMGPDALV